MDRSLDRADTNLVIYHGNARAMITLSSRCYRLVNNEQVLAIRLLGWVSESKNISVMYRLSAVVHIYTADVINCLDDPKPSKYPTIYIYGTPGICSQPTKQPNNQPDNQINKQTNKTYWG